MSNKIDWMVLQAVNWSIRRYLDNKKLKIFKYKFLNLLYNL